MTKTIVLLPCRCSIEVDFPKGERGVSCPRHERSFVIEAVLPEEITHKVSKEIAYVEQKAE